MPTATKSSRKDLPLPELLLSEVLQKVSNAKTKVEKIKLLQKFNSQALRTCLIWNFDESIYSNVPEGEVPYTPNDAPLGTDHTRLWSEYKGLYHVLGGLISPMDGIGPELLTISPLVKRVADEAILFCIIICTESASFCKTCKFNLAFFVNSSI